MSENTLQQPTKETEAIFDISKRMPARDDELAAVCNNGRLKAELGVGAGETLMIVMYCPDDSGSAEVAETIADRPGRPVVVVTVEDEEEALAFARPMSPQ